MATLHSATSSAAVASSVVYRPRRFYSAKPNFLISCVTPSFPSKPTRRNNYLRKKILKTLKHPVIPKPSLLSIDSPPLEGVNESGTVLEIPESDRCQNSEAETEEVQKLEELGTLEVSVPAGNTADASMGVLDKKSIWKYGLWFIGAFVFQTVCAVWVFGSSDAGALNEISTGNEESSVTEVGGDGKDKSRLVRVVLKNNANGRMGVENSAAESVVYIDEVEMERKIEEIRVLAREAREKERLELKKGGYESENNEQESDERKDFKSGIEDEVDSRLIKLRNKLDTARASSSLPLKDSVRKDNAGNGEGNGTLLFQKKYKFKGLPVHLVEKPKGFTDLNGDDDRQSDVDSMRSDDGIHVEEESLEKDASITSEPTKGSWRNVAKERGMNKQGKGNGASKPKVVNGTASEKNGGRSAFGAAKSQKSNAKSQKSGKSNDLDIVGASTNRDSGFSKGKRFEDSKLAVESKNDTDRWWSNLPYVLVIIMQNGENGEGGEGFYTLKNISSSEDRKSCMVAFEDQTDAANFCYILESFFEDMEGFRADVVPLTTKELKEVVTSHTMDVVVAKRGRLCLYAGQPLDEAEMALRDLIEQV